MSGFRMNKTPSPLSLTNVSDLWKETRIGGPSLVEWTARRVTWTCQEGSGSLLGNFVRGLVFGRVRSFILDRRLR